MKTSCLLLVLIWSSGIFAAESPPPAATPTQTPAAPPAGPPKRSAADLEKLVAPIALYPDPLIATLLPASVYPLEIVQAARFVADTNNLAKLDEQPWDDTVKAVARVPQLIQKMNEDISWTIELGEAFLAQDKDLLDAIQSMRAKAQKAGTLQTSPQQIVTVTNMVVEKTVEQQVVVVTNTVVQIQPSNPQVVYVPTYNPAVVYYPPPSYVYNPVAPLITFGAGMAMGAIIANNCDWHHGGCYHSDVDIDINQNINRNSNVNRSSTTANARSTSASGAGASSTSATKKWQPDQSRLSKSGAPSAANSARSAEARGWGSGGTKAASGSVGTRPSTSSAAARPSTGTASASRPSASPSASRPSSSPSASQNRSSSSASRPSTTSSAFGGTSSGASARDFSSRGSSSRSSGGMSSGRSGGGGGRGGGGGGRR